MIKENGRLMTMVTFVIDAIESSGKDTIYSDTRSRALKKNQSARDVVALSIADFFGADTGVSIHLCRSDRNGKVQHSSKIPSIHPNDSPFPMLCRRTCWMSFVSTGQPYDQA